MSDGKGDSPGFLRADIPHHVQMCMLQSYIAKYGTKRDHRKCCFDPESHCDMLCPDFKIATAAHITNTGYTLHAGCFCAKFMPIHQMEELKIHPLDKAETDG